MFIKDNRRPDMPDGIRYGEFVDMISHMNQNSLLLELARRTSAEGILDNYDPSKQGQNWVPPFAYADVARASISQGNREGFPAIGEIVDDYLHASIRIYVPNVEDLGEFGAHQNELRMMHIQGTDQQSPFSRAASAMALFTRTKIPPRAKLKVMKGDWFEEIMGVSLDELFYILMNLSLMFQIGKGVLTIKDLHRPIFAQAIETVSVEKFIHVLNIMSLDLESFRVMEAEEREGVEEGLQRLTHNPLGSSPFITGVTRGYVAPVWHWISSQVSTANLYYALISRAGSDFAGDLGQLFEAYVGEQLALLNVRLQEEAEYKDGKNRVKTTDWILELGGLTILIECKSTRPDKHVQRADEDMLAFVKDRVSKAVKQLNNTNAIFDTVIPADMSRATMRVGIVLTMEPFYAVAETLAAIPDMAPDIPVAVINIRELEALVTLGSRRVEELISKSVEEAKQSGLMYFDLSEALAVTQHQDNPILAAAWDESILVKTLGG